MARKKSGKIDKTEKYDPAAADFVSLPAKIYIAVLDHVSKMVALEAGERKVVGRHEACDIACDDSKMSRNHVEFRRIKNKVIVTDLGSTNGTFVNGMKIHTPVELSHGDEVKAGSSLLTLIKTSPIQEKKQETADMPGPARGEVDEVVVRDPTMVRIYALCDRIAGAYSSLIILGETGVGKEVVARHIHRASPYGKGPFVAINCAAIPENLAESELFGHEKGAFTGAAESRIGHIESADGGTLLLDEISDIPDALQTKLLRFLDNKRITRVGGTREIQVDVRIIGATNRDIDEEVRSGKMRRDFYFRLNQFTLYVPPLRSRPAEISALAGRYLEKLSLKTSERYRMNPGALEYLETLAWPGNIRQLRSVVERAAIMSEGGEITKDTIASVVGGRRKQAGPAGGISGKLEEMEKRAIIEALETCGGNQTRAARLLGLTRRQLIGRLKKYNIK